MWRLNSASTNPPLASGAACFLKDRCDGLVDEARPADLERLDDDRFAA